MAVFLATSPPLQLLCPVFDTGHFWINSTQSAHFPVQVFVVPSSSCQKPPVASPPVNSCHLLLLLLLLPVAKLAAVTHCLPAAAALRHRIMKQQIGIALGIHYWNIGKVSSSLREVNK